MNPPFIILTLPDNSHIIIRVDHIKYVYCVSGKTVVFLTHEDGLTSVLPQETVQEVYAKIEEATRFP